MIHGATAVCAAALTVNNQMPDSTNKRQSPIPKSSLKNEFDFCIISLFETNGL